MRRLRRPLLIALAFAALALVLSACTAFKSGSFSAAQPAGIGAAHLHLVICSETEESGKEECAPEDRTGEAQSILAFAVPLGSVAPATITANPTAPGPTLTYSRNTEVAERITTIKVEQEKEVKKEEEEGKPTESSWRLPGTEVVGYLSAPYPETTGQKLEWPIDAAFGLPLPADGGAFGGPFAAGIASGWRLVDPSHPANRPVNCFELEEPGPKINGGCNLNEDLELPVSDLRIPSSPGGTANVGAPAAVPFSLNFASSASPVPTFALAATTTLVGATVSVTPATFAPTALDPASHRAAPTPVTATVAIPSKAAPGTYDVTLTATSTTGGKISQVAKLVVTKPLIKLGKLSRKSNGTAQLSVTVPAAGTLTLGGKKVVATKRKAKGPGVVKLTIRAKGKAKKALKNTGKAKVKAIVTFAPLAGTPVSRTKSVLLKKTPK
jgi:hypothetical protein